jgi:uncharacterized protein (TIGR03435 family)
VVRLRARAIDTLFLAVLGFHSAALSAEAQTTTAVERFDVASVKSNRSGDLHMGVRDEPGGRFVATNLPLRQLIAIAYKLRDFQLVGGPSWMASDRFDIVAKATTELPPFNPTGAVGPIERMLQTLLAERFRLVVHTENREMPIYALTIARSDGRLGPNLIPSPVNCTAVIAERARTGQALQGPVETGDKHTCGMVISPWAIRIGGAPLSQIAAVLSETANRIVIDRTGLTRDYDLDLQWTPQGLRMNRPPDADLPGSRIPIPPPDPNGATFETAIQEQLGLKLQPERGPVTVLVIDAARPPDPD